jgi:hypothetical protein
MRFYRGITVPSHSAQVVTRIVDVSQSDCSIVAAKPDVYSTSCGKHLHSVSPFNFGQA